jgi:hypothetical protein
LSHPSNFPEPQLPTVNNDDIGTAPLWLRGTRTYPQKKKKSLLLARIRIISAASSGRCKYFCF